MRPTLGVCFGSAMALALGLTAASSRADSVTNNGQPMTSDVKVINGKVYVPLSDVAKSLNETVVKSAHVYALMPAGGANQIANRFTGKVGDTIFTGQFRFTVTGFETATTYTQKYIANPQKITADDGQKFDILHCRIKNGTPVQQEISLSTSQYSGNDDTTLTDDQEQTYQPVNYHGGWTGYDVNPSLPAGVRMLPGAAADFAVVFSVPAATNPKDFIFGIQKFSLVPPKGKQTDIRISLR